MMAWTSVSLLTWVAVAAGQPETSAPGHCEPLRIGAVAYAPSTVTVFETLTRYCEDRGLPVDYVLYSNYDALVAALREGEVDVAWNTPLAHAQAHLKLGSKSKTLAMRDVDRGYRSVLVVRDGSGIESPSDLAGKTLILGSRQAAELTVLPLFYLGKLDAPLDRVKIHALEDQPGVPKIKRPCANPCASQENVLQALKDGKGDAGIIGEGLWKSQGSSVEGLKVVWTTPAFSHCVFTARSELDDAVAKRFTDLLVGMTLEDPACADVLKLEGASKWIPASREGFDDLVRALQVR